MREIKFRAWDKKEREMQKDPSHYTDDFARDINGVFRYWQDIDGSLVFMQSTGLKDKNGTEIYEGDILQIPNDYDTYGMNAGEKYETYFFSGGFRLKPKYNANASGYWLEDEGELEVIGNIYEHPELLGDVNE